uniref:Putative sulfite oxidase mitochondrial n=1 Tax=Moniliophthora roreri TaxID=221103 RepID=A0A0W0EWL6_MONRR
MAKQGETNCLLAAFATIGGVPDINEDEFELEIRGLVKNPVKIDSSKFPQVEVAGEFYLSLSITHLTSLLKTGEGAIDTAVYRGVPVKTILKVACGGILPECQHLEFSGADTYSKCVYVFQVRMRIPSAKNNAFNYAVSVPWCKVQQNEEDLLAWKMNEELLPKIHGYPLRVVVTGMGPVQRQEYLYFTSQNAKYSNGFSIQQTPVSSAIIYSLNKQAIVHDGKISLKGLAYSGGGNWVERIELSPDGYDLRSFSGFDVIRILRGIITTLGDWSIELPVDAEGWLEFYVRCWDSPNNTEPTFVHSAWNWDFHVTSSCHCIKIYSVDISRPDTVKRLEVLKAHGQDINPLTLLAEFELEALDEYLAEYRKRPREPLNRASTTTLEWTVLYL